jgi:hypothetical protein
LALDCLDNETAAAWSLICSDSQWALNALKESGHSAHSILSPLRARLRGLGGPVCFQWVPAHCGLLRNERADKEAKKAANLGPDDGARRGRISFDVVKRLIQSQVKDGPPNYARTLRVYSDGPFRLLQGASRRVEVLLAQLRGGCSLLLEETWKRVQGVDFMCPRCGEEDLEHVLKGIPRAGEPQEKELCAGPLAALGYVDGSGGGGTVLPGGLRMAPVSRVPLNNNNNNDGLAWEYGKGWPWTP